MYLKNLYLKVYLLLWAVSRRASYKFILIIMVPLKTTFFVTVECFFGGKGFIMIVFPLNRWLFRGGTSRDSYQPRTWSNPQLWRHHHPSCPSRIWGYPETPGGCRCLPRCWWDRQTRFREWRGLWGVCSQKEAEEGRIYCVSYTWPKKQVTIIAQIHLFIERIFKELLHFNTKHQV